MLQGRVLAYTGLEGSIHFLENLSPRLGAEAAQTRQRSACLRFTTNATSVPRIK